MMSNTMKQTIFSLTTVDGEKVDTGQLLSDCIPEPASAIVFACEFGCTKILIVALYWLLQIIFKADWSLRESRPAVPTGDGDDDDDDDDEYPHTSLAQWNLLDKDDLMLYVCGLHETEDYKASFIKFASYDCMLNEHDFAYRSVRATSLSRRWSGHSGRRAGARPRATRSAGSRSAWTTTGSTSSRKRVRMSYASIARCCSSVQ